MLGAVAAAAVVAGDAALVEDVALGDGQVHVATGDDAAGGVDDGVTGQQIEAVTGLDQAAVGQVVAGLGRQVIASPQGADVVQVLAGDQVDVVTGDQRAIRGQAVIRLGQVHHGHQDVFAVYLLFFKPDDVVGQRRDLG